jgi:hypothetical protein
VPGRSNIANITGISIGAILVIAAGMSAASLANPEHPREVFFWTAR